jgi:hypothetical protein
MKSLEIKSEKLGMVAHVCNPRIWEAEQIDCELEASLSYIARPHLKKLSKMEEK